MGTDWEPTESDCQWTLLVLMQIKIGGIWRTSYAIYERTGEQEITLNVKIYIFGDPKISTARTESDIAKTKKAIQRTGWDYKENKNLKVIALATEDHLRHMKNGEDLIFYRCAPQENKEVIVKAKQCPKCGFWHSYESCPYCTQEK